MASRFRTAFRKLMPGWLSQGEGELVNYSLNVVMDAFVERARQGLQARFPQYAPADAFAYIARDRKVQRGIGETGADYAERVLTWLDDHRTRGNPFTLLTKLQQHLGQHGGVSVAVRTVDRRGNWYSIDTAGTQSVSLAAGNWDWDELAVTFWSRFWVVIYPPSTLWVAEDVWGVGTWGDGGTWGSTATLNEAAGVRNLIKNWKPLHARCEWIILALDPLSFDPATPEPDGAWGIWGKDDPVVKSRLATARYMDGVR